MKILTRNDLHEYQVRAIEFIKEKQTVALLLDMGLGKTVSTLTAISDLLNDFAISKILIVAPLRVANTTWHTQAMEWEHLQHLRFSVVTGTEKQRIEAIKQDAEIYVTNRESIPWLIDYLGKPTKTKPFMFDMLVIDESSSFKNPKALRFKKLKPILPFVDYRVILTGTPSPNGYLDLWSQYYILDGGGRLGFSITQYRNTYFEGDFMGYKYSLRVGAMQQIHQRLQDITLSMSAEDYLTLPERISMVLDTPMPDKIKAQYGKFEKEMLMSLDGEDITAMTAATLSNKLLQFSSGAIYDDAKMVHHIHDLKFDTLDEIIQENPNDNILVAYNYKHELERLIERYPDAVVLDKEGKCIEAWNNGEIKMLLAHPASAGHGLNLQRGGSLIVWLGFNWSLELYQQFNARLHRQGQTHTVRIMHIAVGSVEYRLLKRLSEKGVTQKGLMDALKGE